MASSVFDYTPPPVLREFMVSDARVRAVRGPVGSAKSTAMAMDLFMRSCQAPVQEDGVRRSRMVIVRNTLQQLRTTCLVTIMQLLRPVCRYKVSESTIEVRMPGIESDWILLPLDTPQNIDRLLSLELTWAWVSEFREIDPEIVESILSRLGRYPSRAMLPEGDKEYPYGIVMETNSFSEDSPWYERLEENLPSNWDYFVQPGAFDQNAENLLNLPVSYYSDLIESNSPEWVEQYVHNRITPSLSGQAVFRASFVSDFHIADGELLPVPGHPLIIGMDTGRNPAAVVCQLDNVGRMLVLAEVYASNMGMEQFLTTKVSPLLAQQRLMGNPGYIVMDPAGAQKSQIGEESVLACAKRLGYQAALASTNNIAPRLRAVERFLQETRNGGAAMLFDPEHCHTTIISMQSKYRYKIKKDKTMDTKPEKSHPFSDVIDSLQYCCLGTNRNIQARMMRPLRGIEEKKDHMPVGAWT